MDATDKILGRMATAIAVYIRGKNLPTYTPSVDMGAYVIVVWIAFLSSRANTYLVMEAYIYVLL